MLLGIILISLLSVSLVSADENWAYKTNTFIDKVVDAIEPVASQILGETPNGQYLFAKVLFFLIILAIVWAALSRVELFNEHEWVLWIVAIAAAVLSTRFLTTEGLINTIILPYSTLGVAISAGLPFVLYFLVINLGFTGREHSTIRRVAWIFFGIIFIFLYITRSADSEFGTAAWIYPLTALGAVIMAVMDGTIHRFFVQLEIEKAGKLNVTELETDLIRKITQADTDLATGIITAPQRDKRIKNYKKIISALHK